MRLTYKFQINLTYFWINISLVQKLYGASKIDWLSEWVSEWVWVSEWFNVDTLIQQGCIKLTRNYSLLHWHLHCYRRFLFHLNAVLLNFIFISHSYKISSNKDVKKKCYLSTKSVYRVISEGSCDTEDWSNGWWKFSFAITYIIIDILKYITIKKKYFKL